MAYEDASPDRQKFYRKLEPLHTAPLWEVLKNIVPKYPVSNSSAHIWRYEDVRPLLMESGDLLTAEEAERRVLVLENPAFPGESRTTSTLYAGIQLILPGETAPAHRHTPSALRFLIEGEQGFTAVGGERTTMREGDFVITPAWAWHDHGNDGDGPVVWMDGLDIPILRYFEAVFSESHQDSRQVVSRPEGDSMARFGEGMLPLGATSPYGPTTPIFNYPYERSREALVKTAQGHEPDPHFAHTLRYANPIDGGWAMPAMATWLTHVQKGQNTLPVRSTDGIVMHVVEGSGSLNIGDETISFNRKDVVSIPGWQWRSIKANDDCFLFFFSDRAVHEKLGFFREERQ